MSIIRKIAAQFLSLGGGRGVDAPENAQERLNICMKNYHRAKKALRSATRRGDIRTEVEARKDMDYWEAYLLECGGMSIMMAALPHGIAGNWNTHKFVVRRREAMLYRLKLEENGYPFLGPYIEVPEEAS